MKSLKPIIYICFLCLMLVFDSFLPKTAYSAAALTASPSATIKQKLDELKKEIASKAALFKKEVDKRLQNRMIFGSVGSVDNLNIQIVTLNGDKNIQTNEYTVFDLGTKLGVKSKKPTVKDFLKDDFIIGLGDVDEQEIMTAKKIVKIVKRSKERSIKKGKVQNISPAKLELIGKDGQKIMANLSSKTTYSLKGAEIGFNELETGLEAIVSGEVNKEIIEAKFVYILPQDEKNEMKKEATASGETKKATPSATIKPSTTPSPK